MILFTVDAASSFGDAQLAQFEKFAPYIVEAELGRTAVTNASFDTLKQFTHLRALHLEETHITRRWSGKACLTLAIDLSESEWNASNSRGRSISSSSMKNLRHVYLYNTPAQSAHTAEQAQPIARNTQ